MSGLASTIGSKSSALPTSDFAADDGLHAIVGGAFVGQDAFAGEAQGDDLPPAAAIGLEFGEDARPDEHHLVARRAGLAKWTARFDVHDLVRHVDEQIGKLRAKASLDQVCRAQSHRHRPASALVELSLLAFSPRGRMRRLLRLRKRI